MNKLLLFCFVTAIVMQFCVTKLSKQKIGPLRGLWNTKCSRGEIYDDKKGYSRCCSYNYKRSSWNIQNYRAKTKRCRQVDCPEGQYIDDSKRRPRCCSVSNRRSLNSVRRNYSRKLCKSMHGYK